MSDWDLVVCGAGPAGCALAAKVAAGGRRVLLLEREPEPAQGRDWVVDVARGSFKAAAVPEPAAAELFDEPDRTFIVTTDRGTMVELDDSPLVPVRNAAYVRRLAGLATESGAVLRTGCVVEGPVLEGGAVRGVQFKSAGGGERAQAGITADCTGIAGAVRRKTPAAWRMSESIEPSDIVLARRETHLIDREAARKALRPGFMMDRGRLDRMGTQGTYSVETCFLDIEAGFADILIGVKPGSGPDPVQRFAALLQENPFIGEKVFGDGAPIPIRRPLDTFVADGLVVLGDSACQAIPAHGSGTASALIAADLCAGAVLRALETGRCDRGALWGYNHAFMSSRGAVMAYYDVIRRHTESVSVRELNLMLSAGLLGPAEVLSGLVPEVPGMTPRMAVVKLRGVTRLLPAMPGLIGAGVLASRTQRHFERYPTAFRQGSLEAWVKATPPRARSSSGG